MRPGGAEVHPGAVTDQPAFPDYDYYEAVTAPLTAAEAAILRERIADGTAARRTVSHRMVHLLDEEPQP